MAGTDQGRIHRVHLKNLASITVSENHGGPVTCVSYARGISDRFATAAGDGTVRVWDTADYGVLTTAVVRDAGEPGCLVLTQVGKCVNTVRPGGAREQEIEPLRVAFALVGVPRDTGNAVGNDGL